MLITSEISYIGKKILDNYQNLTLDEIIDKIILNNVEIEKYILDVKYEYKKNKKIIERKHKLILFGLKDNIKLLNKKCTHEFFLDNRFNVISSNLDLINY